MYTKQHYLVMCELSSANTCYNLVCILSAILKDSFQNMVNVSKTK